MSCAQRQTKIYALKKSVINATNISGVAAIFLSYSLGAWLGTIAFVVAVLIGTYNKYQSTLGAQATPSPIKIIRYVQDPSLTAQILMAAAFINFIKIGYTGFISEGDIALYFFILSIAWFFGFLGDDALRRNDKTNFSAPAVQNTQSLWLKTLIYVTRNPVFYYLITNAFFAYAVFLKPEAGETIATNFDIWVNGAALLTGLAGVLYAFYRAWLCLKGRITQEGINDGMINIIIVLLNFEIAALSLSKGLLWVAVAQILFAIANILCLFETRDALDKEDKLT